MSSQLVEAHRVCNGCAQTKPEASFEKYRRRCRQCRARARRKPVCTITPVGPKGLAQRPPPAIPVDELRERARPDDTRPAPRDLVSWLVAENLALEVPGGLAPTDRTRAMFTGF